MTLIDFKEEVLFFIPDTQDGNKLIGKKEWYIMLNYTPKHENTKIYTIEKIRKFVFIMFGVVVFVILQMFFVNMFVTFVCEHVHADQTKCGAKSLFLFGNGFLKRWNVKPDL